MEMISSSYTSPSPISTEQEYRAINYETVYKHAAPIHEDNVELHIFSIILAVSIFGLVGNGIVVWLLGFRMKKTPFTTYILNLAVADFGVLTSLAFFSIFHVFLHDSMFSANVTSLFFFTISYSTSQFLLTTISIDRCVSVLCPLWYRCRQPERLSAILCVLIWLLTTLQAIFSIYQYFRGTMGLDALYFVVLMNSVVCLTVITVSTLILFVRFCFQSQQRKRGRLLMAILLALFFFLIFAFPFNVIYLIQYNPSKFQNLGYLFECGFLGVSLNSFIHPLLYFFVGRKKKGLCTENLLILQRVFIEEEEAHREEAGINLLISSPESCNQN